MRFRLRTLLTALAAAGTLAGCRDPRIDQIQRGAENVDRHAQQIERAADPQP
ncbi:MAG TPA: hypothetical protein VFV87_05635 [Pirellulaceae bacterium]|nr:hypothetical protein [Pirellulaceae bacterium]